MVVMRVPEVKSMPKLRPLPPIARAQIRRIRPESEKNQRDRPMKSAFHLWPSPLAPSADGPASSLVLPIVVNIACVARTAVNSDTSVPTPSVKAKPLTPAVASMKRMKATITVTTLASMIAVRPLR